MTTGEIIMTETQAALLLYRDILIIMALILFITNQVVALYRGLYQDMIVRRVRKKLSRRQPISDPGNTSKDTIAFAPKREAREFEMPHFSAWKWVGVIAGGIGLLAVLFIAYGILTYNP